MSPSPKPGLEHGYKAMVCPQTFFSPMPVVLGMPWAAELASAVVAQAAEVLQAVSLTPC